MLKTAHRRLQKFDNVVIAEGSLEALPMESNSVDIAVMMLVLHHVVQPSVAIRDARRVLKPGGRLLVADMRPHSHEEYREQMGHIWLGFDEQSMRRLASEAGFTKAKYTSLPADPEAHGPAMFVMVAGDSSTRQTEK
jgi:ArsR family transcriptional regulator